MPSSTGTIRWTAVNQPRKRPTLQPLPIPIPGPGVPDMGVYIPMSPPPRDRMPLLLRPLVLPSTPITPLCLSTPLPSYVPAPPPLVLQRPESSTILPWHQSNPYSNHDWQGPACDVDHVRKLDSVPMFRYSDLGNVHESAIAQCYMIDRIETPRVTPYSITAMLNEPDTPVMPTPSPMRSMWSPVKVADVAVDDDGKIAGAEKTDADGMEIVPLTPPPTVAPATPGTATIPPAGKLYKTGNCADLNSEKAYVCRICEVLGEDKAFAREATFYQHLRWAHGVQIQLTPRRPAFGMCFGPAAPPSPDVTMIGAVLNRRDSLGSCPMETSPTIPVHVQQPLHTPIPDNPNKRLSTTLRIDSVARSQDTSSPSSARSSTSTATSSVSPKTKIPFCSGFRPTTGDIRQKEEKFGQMRRKQSEYRGWWSISSASTGAPGSANIRPGRRESRFTEEMDVCAPEGCFDRVESGDEADVDESRGRRK